LETYKMVELDKKYELKAKKRWKNQ
jgi:hypothetical protein